MQKDEAGFFVGYRRSVFIWWVSEDEFAEDVVRATAERAALRELLDDERIMMENGNIRIAALDDDSEALEDK